MTKPARSERLAYVAAAEEFGAHAATLCDPWDVADLSAHIVLRESRPDVAGGIMIPALAGRLERAQKDLAGTDFGALLDKIRSGPPVWSPNRLAPVDDAVNLVELYVHTEDIRRANGQEPRPLPADVERALGRRLRRTGTLIFRKAPVGVHLEPTGRSSYAV
ncbi:MAG: TIGR03085 family metal-binding protein, partial [Nostocoides sp.]